MTDGVTFTERIDALRYLFDRDSGFGTAADVLNLITATDHWVSHGAPSLAALDAVRDWMAFNDPARDYWGDVPDYERQPPDAQLDRVRDLFLSQASTARAAEYLTWLLLLLDDGIIHWASFREGLDEIRHWLRQRAENGGVIGGLPLWTSALPLKRAGGPSRGSGGVTS